MNSEAKKAKATKKSKSFDFPLSGTKKSENKKSKKSKSKSLRFTAYAAVFLAALCISFFVTKANTEFTLLSATVNGTACEELDYIEIDLTEIRDELCSNLGQSTPITAEEIANAVNFEDQGASARFFGKDLPINKTVLYREDLSKEARAVDKIDFATAGIYYVEYTCDHFALSNKKLVKTIYVSGVEIDG